MMYFDVASTTVWPYYQSNTASTDLKNMPTGSRVKVLGTVSTYLYAVVMVMLGMNRAFTKDNDAGKHFGFDHITKLLYKTI